MAVSRVGKASRVAATDPLQTLSNMGRAAEMPRVLPFGGRA